MAQRRWTSQFSYSMERMPVRLMMAATQSGSTGTFAALTSQGVTYTAVTMGTYGNGITITITGGGTAGAEVVTVVGKAISVQVQSGVSTVTQVRTAVNASTPAAALVTATGTSSSTVATHAAQNLATGTDTTLNTTSSGTLQIPMTIAQTGTGIFTITLADSYPALIGANITLQKTTGTDAMAQLISSDVTTAKTVVFRIISGGSNADLVTTDKMFITLELRNSSTN